jgi:hypothetical protein
VQYCELEIIVQSLDITEENDSWKYIWGSAKYSSVKAYKQISGSQQRHPVYRWLWGSSCQLKHKVFFWLLLKKRLNTRNLVRRKNMVLDSYDCELCLLFKEEKLRHLFFKCPFAKNCWRRIGVTLATWLQPDRAARHIKRSLKVPFTMDIIIIMCWSIWTKSNTWIFNQEDPQVTHCVATFKREFDLVIQRSPELKSWISGI